MAISGPIAPYSNVPIEPQFYQPSQFFISAITLGRTTTVTTTADMNYVIGQEVRLIIPQLFGTRQLNQVTGFVIAIPAANQVTLDIYSANMDAFISSSATSKAQIIAIGDINTGYQSSTGPLIPLVTIPGSFINISPN